MLMRFDCERGRGRHAVREGCEDRLRGAGCGLGLCRGDRLGLGDCLISLDHVIRVSDLDRAAADFGRLKLADVPLSGPVVVLCGCPGGAAPLSC